MSASRDILNLDDIKNLVDTFYGKVRSDQLLAPIFNERIRDQWPVHLEKMYRFWQTVLLNEHTYLGSPFPPHASLPIDHSHFQQWLRLFKETVNELFKGEKAKEAGWRADKMAEMFESRISYFKEQGFKNIF
jgi:hemoglobin